MRRSVPTEALLAFCGGFAVEATDGAAGVVETPLFPPDDPTPDFLVLRLGSGLRPRRPVLSVALVEEVDAPARVVRVRASRRDLARLPEHLPLAI